MLGALRPIDGLRATKVVLDLTMERVVKVTSAKPNKAILMTMTMMMMMTTKMMKMMMMMMMMMVVL